MQDNHKPPKEQLKKLEKEADKRQKAFSIASAVKKRAINLVRKRNGQG